MKDAETSTKEELQRHMLCCQVLSLLATAWLSGLRSLSLWATQRSSAIITFIWNNEIELPGLKD